MTQVATPALLAAFAGPEPLVAAARAARERGWGPLDAFTPYPMQELSEPLALKRPFLPWAMLIGGAVTAAAMYLLQTWSATEAYAFNSGGRPDNSWPVFILAAAEVSILGAGITGFVSLLVGAGLPRLNHPLFDHQAFERASQDQFLLALPRPGPEHDQGAVRTFLFDQGAVWIEEAEL